MALGVNIIWHYSSYSYGNGVTYMRHILGHVEIL
jgi:hypothetical protein